MSKYQTIFRAISQDHCFRQLNAFIMQSKSTFLEFFDRYSSLQICPPPRKNSSVANSSGANDIIAIDHVLCLPQVFLHVSACLFVEFDLLRSFNYSFSGENQPIDENEVRMQAVSPVWSIACMILLNAACSVVGMRDDAFLLHD